ncbi:flavodoxin family protein [Enterococcus sp.]|uniref:flavodoxin family protein n=1 Tax=Enterococcus sp. TaxID=35783 RepID=UPI0028A9AEC9|nr:flavodoxin family protein [Enterococcus sp.]
MKKVVVLIGSRRKNGNTYNFSRMIAESLPKGEYECEFIFPQDFKIKPCTGCTRCFLLTRCVQNDELVTLQNKILSCDVFIIASPVYLHYMTADLKLILDRSAWWAHTLRLEGKPTIVLSTCSSNGQSSVIEPLSEIMTWMGANVIATANASLIPNQMENKKWIRAITKEIVNRVESFFEFGPESNPFLEEAFINTKKSIELQKIISEGSNKFLGELEYWKNSGMINFETFQEYLNSLN